MVPKTLADWIIDDVIIGKKREIMPVLLHCFCFCSMGQYMLFICKYASLYLSDSISSSWVCVVFFLPFKNFEMHVQLFQRIFIILVVLMAASAVIPLFNTHFSILDTYGNKTQYGCCRCPSVHPFYTRCVTAMMSSMTPEFFFGGGVIFISVHFTWSTVSRGWMSEWFHTHSDDF